MNVLLWIVQALLAVAFAGSGLMKISRSRAQLAPQMPYVEDFSDGTIKLIGGLELLAALGLVLPAWTGIATVLTPLAAVGLALVMALAAATHARRKEYPAIAFNAVLFLLAVVVVWGRFGPYSFA